MRKAGSQVAAIPYTDSKCALSQYFRDTKGTRFGVRLKWTQFEKGEYLERLYLLIGVAMLVWMSGGRFVEKKNPKVRMKCRYKGARLSLLRVGILFWRKTMEKLRLTTKFIKANLPLPKVRLFAWLQVQQK